MSTDTGRENRLAYDINDNVTELRRIEAGSGVTTLTTFVPDVLDRPISSTDTFGQTVGYGYDAVGRAISITYLGSRILSQEFDKLGRLARQSAGAN